MKIYIAHSMGLIHKIPKALNNIRVEYPQHEFINPFELQPEIDALCKKRDSAILTDAECELIVKTDISALMSCDLTIAIMPQPTIGTTMEIVYSNFAHKIKPIIICDNWYDINHPWIKTHTSKQIKKGYGYAWTYTSAIKQALEDLEGKKP